MIYHPLYNAGCIVLALVLMWVLARGLRSALHRPDEVARASSGDPDDRR
ncbi:MAG: hypothetical protein K6T63_00175 [Alicyclobacillus herbarius]|nr:hypothetical protein [Alicyclobacillus herbarius]MCL6631021.1 hypothetical protein [Alicyclobacillus herbarius]